MDWIAPVSALVGTALGVAATLVADRLRWRRETTERQTDLRRQLYAEYLAAVSRMRGILVDVARDVPPGAADREQRIRAGFLSPGAYELRHRLAIVAPSDVIAAARATFIALRDIRDCLIAGADATDPTFRALEGAALDDELHNLRQVMRRDLGAPPLV
ncbi:hypothetical protein B4N89_36855 [Embleya scabrispora]|uniref:Uncharacterized protein n=1 Tax=Embleya scabrispora TaxID=159449 RepID=A0A1T3NME6_9ACTN|nr:hypothetical protein [Embleya scabrispora]OPC77841.1 hypothetical protein B4N89_36855 [Embleya scabrispora]